MTSLSTKSTMSFAIPTYSLRVVMDHLESEGLAHRFSSGSVGPCLYEHGCKVDLPGSDNVQMSIQTHPMLAGSSFAETAVIKDGEFIWYAVAGGDDYVNNGENVVVVRHATPEALFDHLDSAISHFRVK